MFNCSEEGMAIQRACVFPFIYHYSAIDQHIVNASRILFRFIKGGLVNNFLRIKYDKVSR